MQNIERIEVEGATLTFAVEQLDSMDGIQQADGDYGIVATAHPQPATRPKRGVTVSDGRVTQTFTIAEWIEVRGALAHIEAGELDESTENVEAFHRAYDKAFTIGCERKKK